MMESNALDYSLLKNVTPLVTPFFVTPLFPSLMAVNVKVTCCVFDFFLHTKRIAGDDVVSGPITALAAASPRHKVNLSGRRTSGPAVDTRRVRKDVRGP